MRPTPASVLLNRLVARGKFSHLQLLLKVAELGSLQRAAAAVGSAQPTVTQTVAALEQLLGVQLFERHARGMRPTPACLDILPAARQMLLGIAETAELVAARQADAGGVVRLLASASVMQGLLLRLLPAFIDGRPDIQVQLREAEGDDLLLAITRGEVDLVVCRRPSILPQGWSFRPVLDDRLAVVCHASHRLAGRRRLGWQQVRDETWLLAPAGSIARVAFDAIAARLDERTRTYPLVTRVLTMTELLLRERQLLALLPYSYVRHLVEAGTLSVLPLPGVPDTEPLGLLAPQEGLRAATQALYEFIRSRSGG